MVTPQDIERINELARKKKTVGLTADEKVEQAELRQAYISGVKSSLRHHVESKSSILTAMISHLKKQKKPSSIKAYVIPYKYQL